MIAANVELQERELLTLRLSRALAERSRREASIPSSPPWTAEAALRAYGIAFRG